MAELEDVPHLHTSLPWFVKDFNFSLAPLTPDQSLEVEPLPCLLYQTEEAVLTLLFLTEGLPLPILLFLTEGLVLLILLLLLVLETDFL
jgi:hypothetical protein